MQYEQQQALMEEKLLALKQAVLLMSAPEGIALASGSHLQAVASENIYMTAGQNVELGAKKNITLAASEKISIFTETEGVEAIVAKGDIISQAQSGNIEVIAKQNISLTSTTKDMTFTAAKTLTFTCAGGAYIRLSGGNIELGCPGDIMMKQSKLLYSGPASMQSNIPEPPDSGPQSMSFMLLDALGNAAPSTMKVSLFDSESKEQIWNSAFNDGESGCFEQPESKNFHAIIGDNKWTSLFSYDNELGIEDEVDDDELSVAVVKLGADLPWVAYDEPADEPVAPVSQEADAPATVNQEPEQDSPDVSPAAQAADAVTNSGTPVTVSTIEDLRAAIDSNEIGFMDYLNNRNEAEDVRQFMDAVYNGSTISQDSEYLLDDAMDYLGALNYVFDDDFKASIIEQNDDDPEKYVIEDDDSFSEAVNNLFDQITPALTYDNTLTMRR